MSLDSSIDKKAENGSLAQPGASISAGPKLGLSPSKLQNGNVSSAEEQIPDIRPVGDALPEPDSSVEKGDKKRAFVSAGEHIDHWSKYLAIDWIYNASVGAVFAYWGRFTESGQKIWSKPVDWGFKKILTPFLKGHPEHLKWSVKQGNTFMSIIAGGMLTIPPLLVLEKPSVKLGVIKSLDRAIYGKERVENDPKFKQAYDEIEHAPKKDFWTGMTSRFAALAPLLASVLIPQSRDWLVKNVFAKVGATTKSVMSKAGLPKERLFKGFSPAEQTKRWNYIHDDAIAMDLSFGLPYAVLHAVFYNMFAKAKSKKDEATAAQTKDKPKAADIKHPVATTVAPAPLEVQVSSKPAPEQEESKKWADAEKHTPAAHIVEKAADNFADKVAEKTAGDRQVNV
jgi:hypothetical protein